MRPSQRAGVLDRPDRDPAPDRQDHQRDPRLWSAKATADGATDAAEALRTTDTYRKEVVVRGPGFVVGGMAKGAAMLAPNMATMLAVLTTDAAAEPDELQAALRAGVADSFNVLTIDGCTSTNDTVLLLASGRAGRVRPPRSTDRGHRRLRRSRPPDGR